MQCGRLRPAIAHADLDQQVFRRLLGIFHKDIEVAIVIEDSGIQQLIFHVATVAPLVRLDQIIVGKGRLRILVQVLHVGMRRRAVEIEVVFLHVFAVVGFAVRQAEHAFFEDRVFAIPEGHAEAQQLLVIADAGKAILAPVIGAGSGLVMGEVVPGISVLAVVLANRSPLPLAKVGSPFPPWCLGGRALLLIWLILDFATICASCLADSPQVTWRRRMGGFSKS